MRLRTGIDVGSALDLVGGVLKWLAPAYLLPTAVAIGYGEPFWAFLVAGAITGVTGLLLDQITGDKHGAAVTPRESFLVVALIWLLVPIFGALPFILDGGPQLERPLDAYFESVSGFTATGATIVAGRSTSCRARCCSGASSATGSAAWASSCSPSRSCRGCGSAGASCCSPSWPARPRSKGSATRSARRRGGCGCCT